MTYTESNKDFGTVTEYEINDILLSFAFIRIYLLIRYIMVITQYVTPRSQRICGMNGCAADEMFAIRAIMKENPYSLLLYSMVISTLIFGYQLRIFEKPLSEASGQNFDSLINSCWCVIATMTTIGYGDLTPKTMLGRLIGVIVSIWGVFIVSFFVVTLNAMLMFNANEEKSYNLI